MPRIDPAKAPVRTGTRYPAHFAEACRARVVRSLGDAAGLTQLGVNLVELPPGTWSSQRHWHTHEDEFVYVLAGNPVLVTDAGEEELHPGDGAGFRAADGNGHHLQNRSAQVVRLLVVGTRNDADQGEYPDIDLRATGGRYSGKGRYLHKDGTAY